MNHIYKTVFNKTTQTWTAVTEWAKGTGKSSVIKNLSTKAAKAPSKPTHSTTLLVKSIITASLTLAPNAFAENNPIATKVVADYNTPKSLQPIILPTSSGLPQINIRTPNAKGISNNHYGQFDVGSAGIVLNNSRKPIVTNLAGYVDGNPYMARGEASLIINQVNSNQPANLNGFVEVAGKKADLIIASPAGILVDGGGFINAGGVSLSTIAPSIDWAGNVHLDPTQSTQGAIGINGKGLNTEGMDYTKLIANTTHINAKVHAGEGDLTLINQNAVDVSHLGGMYAGRIHLIGTQAGVGVNNAGVIASNSTLTLDNKGKLTNSGLMNAKEDIQINSQSINNTGKISAVGTVSAGKQQSLNNEGVIEGNQLLLSANTFTNTGAIKQTGLGDLTLTADTLINKDGASIGHPIITEETDPTTPPQTASTSTPTTPPTDHSPKKAGFLTATTLQNLGESAVIVTGGEIDINVNTLINQKGSINARSLTPQENFNNQGGKINLHDIDWRLKSFNNQGGHLSAKNSLKLNVYGSINNHDGKLIAGQTLSLGTNANINNQNGVINGGTVQLNSNTLNNQGGHIFGKQSLTAKANSIDNTQGQIGGGHLSLSAQTIDNSQGMIQGQSLDVSANELYNSGQLYGENALTLTVNTLSNDKAGVIAGGSSVSISSDTINNLGTFAAGMMSDGSLTGQANLSIHAKTALNSQGKHIATGNASLSSQVLNLENSHSSGGALTLQSEQSLNLKNSVQTASGKMLLSTNETIDNTQGKVSAGTLALNAKQLINRQGSMTEATGDTLSLNLANGIDNTEGFIGSGSQTLQINTNTLDNQKGQIVHTGHKDSQIQTDTLNNAEGQVASLGKLSIKSLELNNQSGQVRGAGFDIDALKLDNHLGKIAAIDSYEAVNSRLITPNLNNTQGIIHSQTGTLLVQTGGFDNNKGTLSANNLELDSTSLTNTGLIYAKQNATLNNQGTFDNKTLIATGGDLDINTQSFTQDKDARLLAGYSYDTKNFEGSSTLKLTAAGQLTNQGVAKATGTMRLTADRLHLEDSKLSADSLALNSNTSTNLSGATVETQKDLSIDSTETVTHDGAHTQAGSIHIKAAALSNKEGVINQTQDTTLELSLNNLDNTKGTLVSKAALASLNIDHLNNTAGKISTDAKTGTLTTKTLNNTQGLMDGNHLDITSSQSLSNQTGILTAKALSIHSAKLDNTQGLIHQSGKDTALSLTIDDTLNNSQTQGEGLGILADKVQITAKTTNNAQGTIKANTLSTHTTTLNNSQGLIRANQANLDTHTTQNTGGLIEAGSLSLSVKEGYTHESAGIKADTLNLTATGGLYNKGELTAESLNLVTDHLHNEEGATIGSNSHTKITADTLNNRGLINGTDTHLLIKEEINNFSNGRIYGDHLAIATKTLNNTPDKQGAKAPIIAARHRLDLGVHTLNNNPNKDRAGKFNKDFDNQAQIVSYGSLHIGGSLDDAMHATGTADTIINKGATIESADEMVINTGKLSNENADFRTREEVLNGDGEHIVEYEGVYGPNTVSKPYKPNEIDIEIANNKGKTQTLKIKETNESFQNFNKLDYKKLLIGDKTFVSDPSRIIAGKGIAFKLDDFYTNKSQIIAGGAIDLTGKVASVEAENTTVVPEYKFDGTVFVHTRESKRRFGIGNRYEITRVTDKKLTKNNEPSNESYELQILDINNGINTAITLEGQALTANPSFGQITHAITIQDTLTGLNKELTGGFIDSKKITEALGNIDPVIINSLDAITKETLTALIKEAKTHPKVMPLSLEKVLTHLDHHIKRMSSIEVRTDDSEVLLNTAGLWQTPSSNNKYLVQSDPNFAHYKPWASSDYLLTRLGQTPSEMHKRLSDGFGEQERLKNSYFKLTGKHWLSDYKNSDEAYKALMDSALAQKDRLNLRAGIALSKEQMQNLTQDMVWMVKQSVTLPDGKKEEVLVPKLYVTANKSAVTGDKSGIYGKYANIDVARLDNQGLIHTQKDAHINATHLKNTQGGKIHADTLVLTAKTLDNTDGHLYANTSLNARVEGKFTSHSNTQKASIQVGDGALAQHSEGELPVTLNIQAGNIDTQGSLIENLGGKSIIQGHNGVVLDSQSITKTTTAKANEHNYHSQTQTKDQGTQIYGVGDVLVYSDQGSITGKALDAKAEGTLALIAKDQITLTEGRNKQTINSASSKTKRRLLSKTKQQNQFELSQDEAVVGQLEANKILIKGEGDVLLQGVEAISDQGIAIKGDRVSLLAAKQTLDYASSNETTKSGLFANKGLSITLGKEHKDNDNRHSSTTYQGSSLSVINGNVSIESKGAYTQEASSIVAKMGSDTGTGLKDPNRGNIYINGKHINIGSQNATSDDEHTSLTKKHGITASLSYSPVGEVTSAVNTAKAMGEVKSSRSKAMAALTTASKAKSLIEKIQNPTDLGELRLSATLGIDKSQSLSTSHSETNQGSRLDSEGSLTLIARGDGVGRNTGNITITGSHVATKDLYQSAGAITYQASTQTNSQTHTNNAKSLGAGVFAKAGVKDGNQGAGYGLTAHANGSKGQGSTHAQTHTNTQVVVSGTTHNDIQGNFVLEGATLDTNHLTGRIGGRLIMTSLSDTYKHQSDQKGIGASVDFSPTTNQLDLGINGNKQDLEADYKAVTHQTGIKTQTSDLVTEGRAVLTGAYLLTKDEQSNQSVFKQGIETKDITNHLNYKGDAISGGVNIGIGRSPRLSPTGLGYGNIDPTHETSTTYAAVTGQVGKKETTLDTAASLNETLINSFDEAGAKKELGLQTQISAEFGREMPKAVGDYAESKELELLLKGDIEGAQNWAEGGKYRVALHTATGLLATGTIEGGLSAGTTAYTIPKIDEYLTEQGFDKETREITLLALSAGIGASIGDNTASTMNAVGQTEGNYLKHTQIKAWGDALDKCNDDRRCIDSVNNYYHKLSNNQQTELKSVCVENYNSEKCNKLREDYFSYNETITSPNYHKIGFNNWNKVNLQNREVEQIFIDIGRQKPSNTLTDKAGLFALQYHHDSQSLENNVGLGKLGILKKYRIDVSSGNGADTTKPPLRGEQVSGGNPVLTNDPYSTNSVETRSQGNVQYWKQREPITYIKSAVVKVQDEKSKKIVEKKVVVNMDLQPTLTRIRDNKPLFDKDGTTYNNHTIPFLPKDTTYTEWTIPHSSGARKNYRIVVGADGKMYFSDHYRYWIRIK